ncbi:F-box DNA helicase 1 [Salarias fasciatus]|uniref:F-box DNA helicase 1 n=1 Tax=Salarias fasciatus TaxID=181472 RepID=A0A672GX97_SALFA|nr:F-box DNA helicase 1 [Salarias fasciatus]XP_029969171.1 F-box DNA helicase 1 [Salarias fasciatus]
MEVAVKRKAKRRHLNAQECEELGQSAAGTDALTQPHANSARSNHDPNRGLYPRTPSKTRRFAPAAFRSPSGRQKSINNFFSVSKVISTSPHKPSLPSTSMYRNGGPNAVEEEDEDDDDISLLAVPLPPNPEDDDNEIDDNLLAAVVIPESDMMDEDEIDDASLLGVPMGLESEATKEPEVDYLEGVTAEMFDDDSEFERCDEEEVEPLPDEHYGLLGTNKALLQPQGCIDDLPEEVLRQILCLVPARDLYRCVSLVCHRWRDIVQDTKFMPFKKRYYRYVMREKEMVGEMAKTLKDSGITDRTRSDLSMRSLVVLMAQHPVAERVRPDDVLERVKRHRLYPQAEASVTLRIPDIKKHLHLNCQGPNPYAAMAVILILSESVADVEALVSLLAGCLSFSAVTEYLNHMAMMLLALQRNRVQISNRLHYNIYYVLHLLENGPFTDTSGEGRGRRIHVTQEQQEILRHDIQRDHVVKIIAFAGTGKTTTLVKYAEQRPHLRFLYVAFNNSVATEARRRFPRNVECRTVHSLAYNDIGKRYRNSNKLVPNVKPFNISFALPKGRGGFARSKVISETLNNFMASADRTIGPHHVPSPHLDNGRVSTEAVALEQMLNPELFVDDALMIWDKMTDLHEKTQVAYFMTHDGYLKLWQLQTPKPRLSDQYDALFIDEAQDCAPVIMDVLLSQRCGKILVGDPHQQIYTFRGAVNALNVTEHTHIYYLTQSFRFGAEIAYVGATILSVCKKVDKILVGGKQRDGVCDETANKALECMNTGVSTSPGQTAILSRCNLGVFSRAVSLIDANPNCRIHFIGDVKNIGLDKILDLWHLLQHSGKKEVQRPRYFRDPFIRSFAKNIGCAFYSLKKYAEQTEDNELGGKLAIVETYGGRIPELVERLNSCYERDISRADFIVGTVHKAKGLEFHTVIVNDDFAKVPCSGHELCHHPDFSFCKIPDDEWNLLYVAVTRSKTSLVMTKNIQRILTIAGEYLLKSEMPPAPLADGTTPPCSVGSCPNCLTPGSAFIMSKPAMNYSDCKSQGGPLCERCVWTRVGPVAFLMTDDVLSMAQIPQAAPGFHRVADDFIMAFF